MKNKCFRLFPCLTFSNTRNDLGGSSQDGGGGGGVTAGRVWWGGGVPQYFLFLLLYRMVVSATGRDHVKVVALRSLNISQRLESTSDGHYLTLISRSAAKVTRWRLPYRRLTVVRDASTASSSASMRYDLNRLYCNLLTLVIPSQPYCTYSRVRPVTVRDPFNTRRSVSPLYQHLLDLEFYLDYWLTIDNCCDKQSTNCLTGLLSLI